MFSHAHLFSSFIKAIILSIDKNADQVTELDQAIGDGDHVYNLQRGLQILDSQAEAISALTWPEAWQKIAMLLMANVGGASGSLYATLFMTLAKHSREQVLNLNAFADLFLLAIESVKQRGKSDVGEKTMLDVLIPVANALKAGVAAGYTTEQLIAELIQVSEAGVEATRDMLATKGRASFLGERSRGHIDAGAKTAQLMICAILDVLKISTL